VKTFIGTSVRGSSFPENSAKVKKVGEKKSSDRVQLVTEGSGSIAWDLPRTPSMNGHDWDPTSGL